jgi:hypothetical protein
MKRMSWMPRKPDLAGSKKSHASARLAATVSFIVAIAGAVGISSSALATESAAPAQVAVTGTTPDAHSEEVKVFVLGLPDLGGARIGQHFALPVLATKAVASGEPFRLTIPARRLQKAGQPTATYVNTEIVAVSQAGTSAIFAPVHRQPEAGTVVRLGRLPSFSMPLPASRTGAARDDSNSVKPLACTVTVIGRKSEATRVGELHVAPGGKVHASFTYVGKADSTITVGRLKSGKWVTDGTTAISNAGTGGNVAVKKAGDRYIEAKFDFEKVHFTGGCSGFAQMATRWDGIAPTLGGQAPASPFRSCHADPHGFITLAPGSSHEVAGFKAVDYPTGAATGFNSYSFGARSGYSNSVRLNWLNTGTTDTFLCGSSGSHQHWPIIYNQSH